MHFCLLLCYGAGAVNPYLAYETLRDQVAAGVLKDVDADDAVAHYIKAINKGVLKVMSKMGISTLHSYRGAQIFEAVGLNRDFVNDYFTHTASRIQGIGIDVVAEEVRKRHAYAYPGIDVPDNLDLDVGGQYQWRRRGEFHMVNPEMVAKLQHAVRTNSSEAYKKYADFCNNQQKNLATLRGLLEFKPAAQPIPLEEV